MTWSRFLQRCRQFPCATPRRRARRRQNVSPPRLEALEGRTLPAITLAGIPTWVEQGPIQQSQQLNGNSSTPPNDPVSGALESIAVNPDNPAQIIAGTVNGGLWRATNANPANPGAITWAPLTDQLASLAIGAVAYDPNDATGNTFYAGTGLWSSSFDSGGSAVGLYRTTDAGASWDLLGNNSQGVNVLATHRIKALVVTGQTILVGTVGGTGIGTNVIPGDLSRDYRDLGGALFRSGDGGATFSQVLPASGLPAGAVPSLASDPNAPVTVYAAVAGTGVFRSPDGGASWAPINTGLTPAAGSSDIELAVQNIGGVTTLYAGVSTGATLNGVFFFNSGTSSWTALAAPPGGFNAGAGFAEKFQLVADPVNAGVVYIDGEGGTGIFRYNPAGTGSWVQIDQAGAQNTFPHGDSHDLKFLDNSTLLESDDGGIYVLPSPTGAATSHWSSFNGNLGTREIYSVAYDPSNRVIFAGTQDTGSPHQDASGGPAWTDLTAGDGQFQAVDNTSLGGGNVFGYSESNNLGSFKRNRFNNANVNLTSETHALTAASNAAPIVITSANHGLHTNDGVFVGGVQGDTAANGGWVITVLNANQFSLNRSDGTASGAYLGGGNWQKVNAAVNASGTAGNPVVLTTFTPHNLNTGDQVVVEALKGTYAALNNSHFYVTVIDATHFSLNGTASDGSTAAGGFFGPSDRVLLKSAIGAADFSGLNAADRAVATTGEAQRSPFVLNSVDPRLMLLGFNGLYEDADPSAANGFGGDVISNITANLGTLTGTVLALAYGGLRGGTGFSNVALVGTTSGQLFFRGESGAAFTDVTAQLGSTNPIDSVALGPQDWRRVYVVTGNRVFFTANITDLAANPFQVIGGGANDNLTRLSSGLGSLGPQLRTITLAGPTPVVGGLGGVYRLLAPPAGASADAVWTKYGQGLPDVVVHDLVYDAATDTLVAGTLGRGAWTVSNASATIAVNGTLTVSGDSNGNNMVLRGDPNNPLRIQVGDGVGNTQSFDTTLFSQVVFQGQGGNDTITVSSDGTAGPGATGDVKFVTFLVHVDGGGQAGDRLVLEDGGDRTAATVTVTGTTAGAGGSDTFFGHCGRVSYTALGNLTVDLSGTAGNVANVPGTAPGVTTNIVGRKAAAVNVGNAGSAQGIQGTLNLENPTGKNTISVDDSANTTPRSATLGTFAPNPSDSEGNNDPYGKLSGLAPGDINFEYADTTSVTITLSNADALNVQGIVVPTTIQGGGTIILSNLQNIQDEVNLDNPAGVNALVLDDTGDTMARAIALSTFAPNPADPEHNNDAYGKVHGLAPADINFEIADTSSVTIKTGSGGGTLNALATAVPTTFVGGGNFTVNLGVGSSLQTIRGALTLENPTGKNTITVDDSADTASRTVTLSTFAPNPSDSEGNNDPYGKISGLAPADVNYEAGDTASVSVTAGSGGNTFRVGVALAAGGTLNLDGGSGTNTLVGPDLANTWKVFAANQGGIAGVVTSFSRFQNLTGGSAADTFVFSNAAGISGKLDGGPGSAADTLDLSAYGTARSVTLSAPGTSGGFAGSEASIGGGFDDIDAVVGGSAPDTLTGLNAAAAWAVNNAGASLYRSGGRSLSFSSFETLDGGTAADVINVAATGVPPVAVNGMGGGDSITVDFGALTAAVNVAETGGGTNTLTVNGAAASRTYTVTAAQVSDNSATPEQVTYSGVQGLTVNGGNAGNFFNVQGTAAGTPVTVNTGNGSNGVIVGSTNTASGVVDDLKAALTVNAGSGLTGLVVNDMGSTANDSLILNAARLTVAKTVGPNAQTVTLNYAATGALVLNVQTGAGSDTVDVQGTAANVTTVVGTGAGNDGVIVGSTSDGGGVIDNLLGPLSLDLGGGTNGLVVNDLGSTTADGVVLFGTSITVGRQSRQLHVNYVAAGGTLVLNIQTGWGADVVNVQGTAANATTIIGAGAGDDTFGVAVTSGRGYAPSGPGSLFLDGGAGADVLVVADLTGGGTKKPNPPALPSGTLEVDYAVGLSSFISYADMESVT